jgi:uncharacterized protein YidB (DUF937 family)
MNWLKGLFRSTGPAQSPSQSPESERVLMAIDTYIDGQGGLNAVVKRFEGRGFMSEARSWVSSGPNRKINSIEALQLIGWRDLSDMANKTGISVDRFRELLAELLPVAIDRATPRGRR